MNGLPGRRILVIEDEMLIALMLQSLLEGLGHHVAGRANTVAGALAILETDTNSRNYSVISMGGRSFTSHSYQGSWSRRFSFWSRVNSSGAIESDKHSGTLRPELY